MRGKSVEQIAEGISSAFVRAKFRHIDASAALYAISDDVEGRRIAQEMHTRSIQAMATLFETAQPQPVNQPEVAAATLLSAMAGVSRSLLESGGGNTAMDTMQTEMVRLVRAYLSAPA